MMNKSEELSLQEIHEATFELLVKIRNICEKIGVQYFLAFGTLIGAVRHKGFIPWDDDADLWMTRDNYDKFFEFMKNNKDSLFPLSYCSRNTTENYALAINRVTDMRYKYVDSMTNIDVDYGVFVDVYPLDFVGDSEKKYKNMYRKIDRLNSMYYVYLQKRTYSENFIKGMLKRIYHCYLKIKFNNRKDILNYIDEKTNMIVRDESLIDSPLLGVVIWYGYIQCYDKALFDEVTELEFKGELFLAPKRYDELLRYIYGDYMQLPPKEKRVPYHNYKIYRRNM